MTILVKFLATWAGCAIFIVQAGFTFWWAFYTGGRIAIIKLTRSATSISNRIKFDIASTCKSKVGKLIVDFQHCFSYFLISGSLSIVGELEIIESCSIYSLLDHNNLIELSIIVALTDSWIGSCGHGRQLVVDLVIGQKSSSRVENKEQSQWVTVTNTLVSRITHLDLGWIHIVANQFSWSCQGSHEKVVQIGVESIYFSLICTENIFYLPWNDRWSDVGCYWRSHICCFN